MQIHQVKRHNPRKKSVQVGRGGKRGKTAGRGTKGQKARAGRKLRPEMRDIIKTLPKLRGRGVNSLKGFQAEVRVINLDMVNRIAESGDTVNPQFLVDKGAFNVRLGKLPRVKILGDGEIVKKITVEGCAVSASARAKIEKAGGGVK